MKLIVLAERDILTYLRKNEIYPSEFYTDIDIFRKRLAFFDNAVVVTIFAGSCAFSKKVVLEILNSIDERVKDKEDNGIKASIVLSDTILTNCNKYYIYDDHPLYFKEYSRDKKVSDTSYDIWGSIDYEKCDIDFNDIHLAYIDKNVLKERLKGKEIGSDDYYKLIKVPTV